ncbi:MAG: hypothetical protein R3F17_17000 [Planctomycetota bacterium]
MNHKQFVADHVPGFAGHRIDRTLWRAGEEMPWNLNAGGSWLLRRGFGAAGRGRIRVIETVGQAEATWIAASHRMGDLCLEPWVQVEAEYSTAGFIERDGGVEVALPRIQEVDRAGQWLASTAIERGDGRDMELLRSATRAAGTALHQAGYWGPYSLDGFRYLAADGSTAWQLLGDLNARFTMAWGLSFRAELRGDRLAAVRL